MSSLDIPIAHSCIFSLELPSYSSVDIMRDKLRYAIFNSQSIDIEDMMNVAMSVSSVDWEE